MKFPFVSVPNLRLLLGLALACTGAVRPAGAQPAPPLNPDQVDQLMGPIALYPDALVALILPASTVPTDIVLAQRYLTTGGDPDQIDNQPWNESVKGLARYPMLIQWLDENLTWTQQLGNAFVNQPDTMMDSVQRLRSKARANGTLTSTPQQKLVLDGDVIEIVPAQPDVIYVPYYDSTVVYGQPAYYGGPPYVTFGVGFAAGYWLAYDFNWHSRVVIVGDRHHNWSEHHDWSHRPGPGGQPNYGNNWRPWTPPVHVQSNFRPDSHRPPPGVIQPRPFPRNSSGPGYPDRPRDYDHSRPPTPSHNPGVTPDNREHRPAPNPGSLHAPYPQPGPPTANPPRPSGPPETTSPGPRPDMGNPHSNGGPPRSAPGPTQPPSGRPPGPNPVPAPSPRTAPPHPAPPHPAPPPPPPKDNPRDDKPEVQR